MRLITDRMNVYAIKIASLQLFWREGVKSNIHIIPLKTVNTYQKRIYASTQMLHTQLYRLVCHN